MGEGIRSLMLLYLVRHGQTEANRHRTFQGTTDFPLNDTGHTQALDIMTYLRTEPVTAMYTSPMIRARETAGPLAEHFSIVPESIPDFHEVDCGRWEGVVFDQIVEEDPERLGQWLTDPEVAAPDGESLGSVYRRVKDPLNRIVDTHRESEGAIVIVAHGAVNRAIICHLLDIQPDRAFRFDQHNGCINRFDFRLPHPPKLTYCNLTTHLGG